MSEPTVEDRIVRALEDVLKDFISDHVGQLKERVEYFGERLSGTPVEAAEVAARYGAGLVTTEKDWVRLPPAWRDRAAVWPVRARFEDEAAVLKLLPGA